MRANSTWMRFGWANECTLAVDVGGNRKTWRLMDATQRRWSQLESRVGGDADQTGLSFAPRGIDFEKQTSPVS